MRIYGKTSMAGGGFVVVQSAIRNPQFAIKEPATVVLLGAGVAITLLV
ncbi:MAG: hypothetical protein NTX87_01220 [Planctomycetota bacterium]|nr:hypothetical protein [Planctomycetota bacterium]